MRFLLVLFFSWIGMVTTQAQYDKGYFRSPLGIPLYLAGNFGEFRPNHFHTGLDFKTNQVENLPVYAVADGFVSRIAVSHSGYGYCLYVQHPNGFTSVYAHLNSFDQRISNYLLEQQRKKEQWNVDVTVDSGKLVYKKGDQIALSGNTGGSIAPHLHFEIRNTLTEKVINGMHFGFPIVDKLAPVMRQVGIYDAAKSVYMQEPLIRSVSSLQGKEWVVKVPSVRLGVIAEDFMNNSTNTLGIYKTELIVDGNLIVQTEMNELDFANNKSINGYTDYKYRATNKDWMQVLYRSQNNPLDFYKKLENNGVVDLVANKKRHIIIKLHDYDNNFNEVSFYLVYEPQGIDIKVVTAISSLQPFKYRNTYYQFNNDGYAFYDEVPISIDVHPAVNKWSKVISVHQQNIPLAKPQELYLKLLHPIPFQWYGKLVFRHEVKAQALPGAQAQSGMKATIKNGQAFALIKTLGNYYVDIDTLAPKIKVITNNTNMVQVQVTEETTNIKSFKAYLNDKFVVFSRKGNVFTSEVPSFYEKKGVLKIIVADDNDNKSEVTVPVALN